MALFKIFNNIDSQNTTLPSTYTKGYMYYDAKESIFYIDTAGEGGTTGTRQKINAWGAEKTLKDSLNQQIDTTYIKNIVISENNELLFTTGDGRSHSIGEVNITKEDIGLGNVENKSSATIRSELTKTNITTALGYTPPTNDTTYSAGTGLSLSGTTFNHSNSIIAGTVSDGGATRTLAFGGTFKIPSVTYDDQGHIISTNTITLTMPSNPNTNTASAVDNILDGSNSGTAITYAPYTSQQTNKLSFDTSDNNPTRTDRLNLNGYLYATKLYSGGQEVLTAQSLTYYKTKQIGYTNSTGISESTTATRFVYSISQDTNGEITFKTRPLPTYNNYTLPTATTSIKGGVIIGSNINVNTDGKISIDSTSVTTALGYTPYNSSNPNGYTSNVGTITGIKMNGSSKGTFGVVDLGTVITDVSGKLDKSGGTMTGVLTLKGDPTSNLQAATKQYVDNILNVANAVVFKGGIASGDNLPAANCGDLYRVTSDGTINGIDVWTGDTLICTTDNTSASTPNSWLYLQTGDGTVIGPNESTAGNVAVFTGGTGKGISDSGFTIAKSVPEDAQFTDTTYESKIAVNGGTVVSLVTTGEKYIWNNKGTYSKPSGGIPKSDLASAVQTSLGKADTALQDHQTVENKKVTLAWGTLVTIATIGNTDIEVALPDLPVYTGTGTWE